MKLTQETYAEALALLFLCLAEIELSWNSLKPCVKMWTHAFLGLQTVLALELEGVGRWLLCRSFSHEWGLTRRWRRVWWHSGVTLTLARLVVETFEYF